MIFALHVLFKFVVDVASNIVPIHAYKQNCFKKIVLMISVSLSVVMLSVEIPGVILALLLKFHKLSFLCNFLPRPPSLK
jgi:hypothetical protein